MKSSYLYTRRVGGLDSSVWLIMTLLILACTGLLGYQVITAETCSNYTVTARPLTGKNNIYYTREPIRFSASAPAGNLTWNYGDGSHGATGLSVVSHTYEREGRYDVSATINGRCNETISIIVQKRLLEKTEEPTRYNDNLVIAGEETTQANKKIVFISNLSAAAYEWTVLNRNEYKRVFDKSAQFTFNLPGVYTIRLKLNNDRNKVYTKKIYVLQPPVQKSAAELLPIKRFPIPPPSQHHDNAVEKQSTRPIEADLKVPVKTPEKQFIEISDAYLKKALEGVMNGTKNINEFESFLCEGSATKVLVNDAADFITFNELCRQIKNKRYRLDEVKASRDVDQNRCIINVNVTIKRKGFLGRWVNL